MNDFYQVVLLFSIFSVAGYIAELINCIIWDRKLLPRGFLFGPYLPIYGWGCILITFLCLNIRDDIPLIFLISMAACSVLEFLTSLILEKIFKVRWWDYSDYHCNLNGRVCLRNAIIFGVVGVITVKILPVLEYVINLIPRDWQIGLAIFMLVVLALDTLASFYANCKVKNMEDFTKTLGDQTVEIKRNAKKVMKQLVKKPRSKKKK